MRVIGPEYKDRQKNHHPDLLISILTFSLYSIAHMVLPPVAFAQYTMEVIGNTLISRML